MALIYQYQHGLETFSFYESRRQYLSPACQDIYPRRGKRPRIRSATAVLRAFLSTFLLDIWSGPHVSLPSETSTVASYIPKPHRHPTRHTYPSSRAGERRGNSREIQKDLCSPSMDRRPQALLDREPSRISFEMHRGITGSVRWARRITGASRSIRR